MATTVKVYKSAFTAMYTAVTSHRQPCRMKLVCVGPDEKIVGIHGIGFGMDEDPARLCCGTEDGRNQERL